MDTAIAAFITECEEHKNDIAQRLARLEEKYSHAVDVANLRHQLPPEAREFIISASPDPTPTLASDVRPKLQKACRNWGISARTVLFHLPSDTQHGRAFYQALGTLSQIEAE